MGDPGDASQTRQNTPRKQGGTTEREWYTKLIGDLKDVTASLGKREGVQEEAAKLGLIIAGIEQVVSKQPAAKGLEARLERIETMLRQDRTLGNINRSWAGVAASGIRQAGGLPAIQLERHIIRV